VSEDPSLAAVVLTFNVERHIAPCLESLSWVDRLVVVDGGPGTVSTDRTVELAQAAGAEVIHHLFRDYAHQRNVALDQVRADWVFFVDADERATPELAAEVRSVIGSPGAEVGYWVPRHNYIFGRLTLGAGWYPDYQMRLVRPDRARWERPVHEVVVLDGPEGVLEHPLIHYNYDDLTDFKVRQRRYVEYDAGVLYREGVRPRFYTPYTQAVRHFWWRLVTLGGVRDGLHGLRLSLLMAYYEALKYRRLSQMIEAGAD
jgi:glycosyltransferase involved in cell wall biosynthesis